MLVKEGRAASVVRWRRYGKDRLYVTGADGVKIGWHDVITGEDNVEVLARAADYAAALDAWSAGVKPTTMSWRLPAEDSIEAIVAPEAPLQRLTPQEMQREGSDDSGPPLAVASELAEPNWQDLAGRRAGTMAREQATALKQAAPVKTFLARALGVHNDERAWRIGSDGEELVATQLARLAKKDPRWCFLHAVPVGENGSDIDHVVVGPGGVYTLNAKHHPGAKLWVGGDAFMVNGRKQPYIRNSRHEANRATRLLRAGCGFPVSVAGVVVPVGAAAVTIKTPPIDVHVVNRKALRAWLRRRPVLLTDAEVEAVFDVARRSTTWRPGVT